MAKDLFHQVVKDALIKDGWNITHDPFPVDYGDIYLLVYDVEERSIVKWKK